MKDHILPKQAKQLTKEQFYALFNGELVDRKDWANYHHRKVTVSFMLTYLHAKEFPFTLAVYPSGLSLELYHPHGKVENSGSDACDLLWDALVQLQV